MNALFATPLPGLLLTIWAYLFGEALHRRLGNHPLVNPTAVAILVLAVVLKLSTLSYATYFESAKLLHWLLGPATVALAVPLARELHRLRALAGPITVAVLLGTSSAALSAIVIAKALGASPPIVLSVAPKSVTTPIAMGVSEKLGGIPSLTAVIVIVTGIFGAVFARTLLDRLGVRDPAARGLAMGVAAHGLGTAAIYRESPKAGAYSGLAMGLSGLITALMLPFLVRWLAP